MNVSSFFYFFILRNGFQKLNKIKVCNRQYKQLEELRRKTRDANGWVGCFLCQNLRIDLHFLALLCPSIKMSLSLFCTFGMDHHFYSIDLYFFHFIFPVSPPLSPSYYC